MGVPVKKTPCKKTENRNRIHPLLAHSLAHPSHTLAISASMTNLNITVQYHNITHFHLAFLLGQYLSQFTWPHFHSFTFHLVNFHSHHVNSSTQACISSYLRVNATCPICRKPLNEITCTPRFSFLFLQILTVLSFPATWC